MAENQQYPLVYEAPMWGKVLGTLVAAGLVTLFLTVASTHFNDAGFEVAVYPFVLFLIGGYVWLRLVRGRLRLWAD